MASECDVIVVGFGVAGVSAAIEASDAGARVLALDRAWGGGASALSGGVIYAGGGTEYQKEAGFDDSPENMFNYMKHEVNGVVSDKTLRRFCETSVEMISWLEAQGCTFEGSMIPYKTSNPTDKYHLYFSGNEKAWPYSQHAIPAPRGHRQVAPGIAQGAALMANLLESARSKGVEFRPLSRVESLIIEDAAVIGVRYRTMESTGSAAQRYRLMRLLNKSGRLINWVPAVGERLSQVMETMWEQSAHGAEAHAKAVILSGGGFIFNPEMRTEHAGPYGDVRPLGTAGDDGSSIQLGLSAGGVTAQMHRFTAWRFFTPPSSLVEAVSVDGSGERIANEDLYGATFGRILAEKHGGRGYLVLDSEIWKQAKGQVGWQSESIQRVQLRYLFTVGHKKANTLEGLARKIGVPADALQRTVKAYNDGFLHGNDPAHKAPEFCRPILRAPFYAIDVSLKNSEFFPVAGLTLGGLKVDEDTGGVLRADGTTVSGLYAAGRTAIGICSENYLSGNSLADGVFSGRRAGADAARIGSKS